MLLVHGLIPHKISYRAWVSSVDKLALFQSVSTWQKYLESSYKPLAPLAGFDNKIHQLFPAIMLRNKLL